MIGDVVKMNKTRDYYVQINDGGTLQKIERQKWYRVFHKIKTAEETKEIL